MLMKSIFGTSATLVVVVVLAGGALTVGLHAQRGVPAPPAQPSGPRPATAPPLVPVRVDVDGNFRIAPPYTPDPAFTDKPSAPKGRVVRFTMNSAESKIFPTAPVGGAVRGDPPVEPPQHQTFQRQVAVYIPGAYTPNTPAPFIVVQDGGNGGVLTVMPLEYLKHRLPVTAAQKRSARKKARSLETIPHTPSHCTVSNANTGAAPNATATSLNRPRIPVLGRLSLGRMAAVAS